ncbi:hypothetical protein [Flavobacterium sp.]|uniref:hypothetical protein n=1 Tax=Flavobacterium sp. TaxID=239 RepID=UPI002C87F38B|nr:hypothetical protein [Flavobacterium sp.]HSD08118.1 hypothetical protein [Flavobacterium sp.]
MKVKKEIKNGFYIFICIGVFFLLMEFLGLSNLFYLRLINTVFVVYAVNDTLKYRIAHGKKNFVSNAVAALTTSGIGVFLSVLGLLIYSYLRGGDEYINNLSKTFLFGGNPSINMYCLTLFFEGMAASLIVTMLLMLYYNNKFAAD